MGLQGIGRGKPVMFTELAERAGMFAGGALLIGAALWIGFRFAPRIEFGSLRLLLALAIGAAVGFSGLIVFGAFLGL
jgi:hypothetical protein